MTKKLINFRLNKFKLFGTSIAIAGMAGAHNNTHLESSSRWFGAPTRLAALRLLKQKKRLVYINLHEKEDFAEEAKAVGIEYHWLKTEDFPKIFPATTFDRVYDIVKKASLEGKKVTISCGAGDGRTGTTLAALKLRELVEEEFRNKPEPEQEVKPTESFKPSTYSPVAECTPLVKQAIECIRNERLTGTEEDEVSNGVHSVETVQDVHSLVAYEKHLRATIANELKIKPKAFAQDVFGAYLFAGPNPTIGEYKSASLANLQELKNTGIKNIYSLEKEGNVMITEAWPSMGQNFQHITGENDTSYLLDNFRAPSVEQMDAITDSMLNAIGRNEGVYLHCDNGIGRTGTLLAALYMKKTGLFAEEAIEYVRVHYDPHAVETKEQVEALINFGRFLNKKTLVDEIGFRYGRLLAQYKDLPPAIQSTLRTLLVEISNSSKVSPEIAYQAIIQTTLLLRPEVQTGDWVKKYKKLANEVYGHPLNEYRALGIAMYALAVTAAAVLVTLVSIGTVGLGLPVLGGFGGCAATLLPSHGLYKRGQRHSLSASMNKLASNCAHNNPIAVK